MTTLGGGKGTPTSSRLSKVERRSRPEELLWDSGKGYIQRKLLDTREEAVEHTAGGLEDEKEEEEDCSDVDEEELLRNATPYDQEYEESLRSHEVLFEVQAQSKFEVQEEGDLGFKQSEILTILESSRADGWLLAENALGERGLVPSNFVKQLSPSGQEPCATMLAAATTAAAADTTVTSITPRRGRELWLKLKQNVNQTSLADVLCALGTIPSGFRDSTMAKLLANSPAYLASTWVTPHPSPTGMGFRDLKWNHSRDHLQMHQAKVSREIVIIMARKISLPGNGITVLSRHVRVAVFNKNNILSNIHTVKAAWSHQEEKTWKFLPKSQTATNSLYHGVLTTCVDSSDINLELLFELAISFKRKATGEKGEISCGWSSLPLYNPGGIPTASKIYELKVHGGTPFESGIPLDESNIKASGTGLFPSILRGKQMPHFYVRVSTPSRTVQATQALLPPTIITPSTYTLTINCFRHLVGMTCLRGKLGLPLPTSIVRPALNVFLKAIDQSDVMDNTVMLLQEQLKLAKRVNKRQLAFVAEQLEQLLLQYTYPVLNSSSFPRRVWDSEAIEQERLQFMENMCKREDLSTLLAADIKQNTILISEQVFCVYR